MKIWLRFLNVVWKSRKRKELDHEQILTNCIEARMKLCQLLLNDIKISTNSEQYNHYKTMLNNTKKDLLLIPITVARRTLCESDML